ncbi:MAG: DegT/DnrJ/EryC1/StrS family aminotransferase, partial [Bacteroidota bacterium]
YSSLNYQSGDFPHAEYLAANCVSLPMYPELSNDETSRVIDLINKF